LHRNCILKHTIEGTIDGRIAATGRRGIRRKQLPDNFEREKRILEIEGESTRSPFVEDSLWKRLWTCRKADCEMKETQNRTRLLSYEFPWIHNSQTLSTMQYIRDITSINKTPSTVANSRLAAQVIACLLCGREFITVSTTARH
jgi:hypothetical protein